MTTYGLIVDYQYCTGCNTCEVACQMEHGLPVGQFGIKVNEVGPWKIAEDTWELEYFPTLTQQCDLCRNRTAVGKQPSCVQNCMGDCLRYGALDELIAIMGEKDQQMILLPKQSSAIDC